MKTTVIAPHKSSIGNMDANIAVLLMFIATFVLSWIPYIQYIAWAAPIVFFVLEKQSAFVKFQAVQGLIIAIVRTVLTILFNIITWAMIPKDIYGLLTVGVFSAGYWIVSIIAVIVGLALTALVLYIIVMAYGYKNVEVPVIGPLAQSFSK